MSQGREQPDRPPIRGVRLPEVEPLEPGTVASLDPWGAQDAISLEACEEVAVAAEEPAAPRRGGGILTIPLLCVGVATIACVTLLPLADENHQLAWEREKLRVDLAHIKE